MARVIANKLTRVYVGPVADVQAGATPAEVEGAEEITEFLVSLDTATTGNEVDTPNFATDFETSIPGTYSATVSMELYRDDEEDTAWETLVRGFQGVLIVHRFGSVEGNPEELYPIRITARSPAALANNESQRFTVDASVYEPPNEDSTVAGE